MRRRIGLLILFSLCAKLVLAQSNSQWINNDSIMFGIGLVTSQMQSDSTYSDPKFVVMIKLTESKNQQIEAISKADWLKLLQNTKTDWAANLLLYYLYAKSAVKYTGAIKSKAQWIDFGQQSKDIGYWKRFLSSH